MAKIVIIAPSDVDVADAIKLLKGAGHDVDVEEPTPKSLLHIVLGLMGPNAYGFGAGYAYTGGPDATDDPGEAVDDMEAIESDVTAEPDLDGAADIEVPADDGEEFDFNFEGLTVNDEVVAARLVQENESTLVVTQLANGPKTTYKLNESAFSFWPNDVADPIERVDVGRENVHTSLEVHLKEGEKQELLIGKDLAKILKLEPKSVEAPKE